MYVPEAFKEERDEVLVGWMRRWPFAVVVTGDLEASHVPMTVEERRGGLVLVSHLARANRQWERMREGGEVVVIFSGPHAYVSPAWYEKGPAVPTWNYVAVHAYGRVRVIEDVAETVGVLKRTVEVFDQGVAAGGMDEAFVGKLAAGVVAFEVNVTRVEGKAKLSQNRSDADFARVLENLGRSEDAGVREVAAVMREFGRK